MRTISSRATTSATSTSTSTQAQLRRLLDESARRERWMSATTEITRELSTHDGPDALQLVADRAVTLAGARLALVVLTHGTGPPYDAVVVDRASGTGADAARGAVVPRGDGFVRRCLSTREPELLQREESSPTHLLGTGWWGSAVVVPLPGGTGVRGALCVLRDGGAPRFTGLDVGLAASFAHHAALALDRADAHAARTHRSTLADHDRIARDLHDHVVQRLFAAGLTIQGVAATLGSGPQADRLGAQVEEIDAAIRQIRTTIFSLTARGPRGSGLRAQVLTVASATAAVLDTPAEMRFRGPLDLLVPPELYADVVAVVREALTNVGRHAHARRVEVTLSADAHELRVEVLDDGRGMRQERAASGLVNLRARAEDRGGSFAVHARSGGGTRLLWTVPL